MLSVFEYDDVLCEIETSFAKTNDQHLHQRDIPYFVHVGDSRHPFFDVFGMYTAEDDDILDVAQAQTFQRPRQQWDSEER